jgi:cysteinyl-tRNA synthetase
MALKLFNTLGREIQEFKPVNGNKVGMYCCGPTVYNYVHIGNLRAYMFNDLLRRYLKYLRYDLTHVMNVTDVDDKTIRDSIKENKSLKEFTTHYKDEFLKDLKTLNIQTPEIMPLATEHINEMVELVKKLLDNNFAYEKNKDVYFSISKDKNYGKLACLDIDNLKKNADGRLNDSDEYEKDDARDFALWKSYDESDGNVFWDTKIGKGRPGWHIECSAMSSKYLGETFDIHTGGEDLIFPHHTNEIAQSENANSKKFCNFWLHNAHLVVDGEKMSKSKGNFYTLRDLLSKGLDPMAIRYELLGTHYRQKLNFTIDGIIGSKNTLNKIQDFVRKLKNAAGSEVNYETKLIIKECNNKFEESLNNDLNISGAFASLHELMNKVNKLLDEKKISKENAIEILKLLEKQNSVYGFISFEEEKIPQQIKEMAEQRLTAKKNKDWAKADELRNKINELGYAIADTKEGYTVSKK